jgi:hypothetical protein
MNDEITDTPRTVSAMSLKQNYELSEKDCPVYENYVHAAVCAEIERELTASKAEVERLKAQLSRAVAIGEALSRELYFPAVDELNAFKASLSSPSSL